MLRRIPDESESLSEVYDAMLIVGPAGYADRESPDDYAVVGQEGA